MERYFKKEYEGEDRVLAIWLEDKARYNKDKVFLQMVDGEAVTYKEINERANRVANGLLNLGVKKGDNVCVMLPTCPEYIYTWFGCTKIGAVEVPVNASYKGDLLQYIINNAQAKIMVVDQEVFLDRIREVQNQLEKLQHLIVYSGEEPMDEKRVSELKFEAIPYRKLMESPSVTPEVHIRPNDPLCIIYTSGTTGRSKGVVVSHNYWYYCVRDMVKYFRLTSDDIMYTCLPFFHGNAKAGAVLLALLLDTKVVAAPRFSATRFWDDIRSYNVTQVNLLGAMMPMLYNQPRKENDADNPARMSFAVPVPKDIHEDFEKRFNIRLIEGYGSSEAGMVTYMPYDEPRYGSCGKAVDGYEVKIFDDDDNELPDGEVGEIASRSKEPYTMMLGYYDMPEETLKAFRNLWYHPGDAGYKDEDGYFYFVGRTKEAIRRRGENISAFEVEKAVDSHPAVLESAAHGVPSELGEEEVKIVVVLKEGEKLKPEELIAYLEDRLAYFAVPRYVEFRDSLPKTPTDKVEKYKLKEQGITDATWDREKAGYKLKR